MGYRKYNRNYRRRRGNQQPASMPARLRYGDTRSIEARAKLVAQAARRVSLLFTWIWQRLVRRDASPLPPPLPAIPFANIAPQPATMALPAEPLPYCRSKELLTKGERALWYPLYRAVKGKYRVFAKVRLADVVGCPKDHADEYYWFRKIGRYHVDFVLCEPDTTAPLLVIELDDRSHRRRARKERDAFKDEVLRAAGMPIYRIAAQRAYDSIELAERIERLISNQSLSGEISG